MAQTSLTTSVGMLALSTENRPLFSTVFTGDAVAFDEGPFLRNKGETPDVSSGSLSHLSSSYPFLQGVEITRPEQYMVGLVKIWSGDSQHRLRQTVIGQERVFFTGSCYVDTDRLFAETLVRDNYRSFTSDNDNVIESHGLNGTIEPLQVRDWNTQASRTIKGEMMGGTPDESGATCQVLSVDVAAIGNIVSGFVDSTIKRRDSIPTRTVSAPFVDVRLVRNVPAVSSEAVDMTSALSFMTGSSTSEYIRYDQRSAPCGWCYDNVVGLGTDSLTFGGMTY